MARNSSLLESFIDDNLLVKPVSFVWFEYNTDNTPDTISLKEEGVWDIKICGKNAGRFTLSSIGEKETTSRAFNSEYLADGLDIKQPYTLFHDYLEVLGTQVLEGAKPSEIDVEDDFYNGVWQECGYSDDDVVVKYHFPTAVMEEFVQKLYFAQSAF